MISAWHLLWIVPVAFSLGFVVYSLVSAGSDFDDQIENYDTHIFYM